MLRIANKCALQPTEREAERYGKIAARRLIEHGMVNRPLKCQDPECKSGGYPEIYLDDPRRPQDVKFYCRACRCKRQVLAAKEVHVARCGLLR